MECEIVLFSDYWYTGSKVSFKASSPIGRFIPYASFGLDPYSFKARGHCDTVVFHSKEENPNCHIRSKTNAMWTSDTDNTHTDKFGVPDTKSGVPQKSYLYSDYICGVTIYSKPLSGHEEPYCPNRKEFDFTFKTDEQHYAECPAQLTPVSAAECPVVKDIAHCKTGLQVGDLCEGDGECGTARDLDNCGRDWDIYRVAKPPKMPIGPEHTFCMQQTFEESTKTGSESTVQYYEKRLTTMLVQNGKIELQEQPQGVKHAGKKCKSDSECGTGQCERTGGADDNVCNDLTVIQTGNPWTDTDNDGCDVSTRTRLLSQALAICMRFSPCRSYSHSLLLRIFARLAPLFLLSVEFDNF